MAACPNCGQNNPETARFCHACAAPLTEAAGVSHEVRKTVTVVFCDVIDSTPLGERLDPELLRRVMSRFFGEMRTALEAHGGTVEKFIGDAVMAVFGVPSLHEVDALRAARAAVEMRERLAALNEELRRAYGVELETRVGINTGPVVAGGPGALTLATGDAVNLAKRLEEAAAPGEILIGAETNRLVRDAVEAVALEPRALKGKAEAVASWRLERLAAPGAAARERHTPLVGRHGELEALAAEFERAAAEESSRLVTVLGAAGIGKSRLAPRANARTLTLAPLSGSETDLLLADSDLSLGVRARIAAASEGNPLFAEQMAALLTEEGEAGEELLLPPSIQALLAARLDRLSAEERTVIETAAVVGRGFWRGAVRDLAPAELREAAGTHLMALVRKELVEPDASTLAHEDAFRFRHVLIRDAAYEGMPKKRRADLHERFAGWIDANAPERATELEEIVGYRLEQAYRLRVELGRVGDKEREIARRAAD